MKMKNHQPQGVKNRKKFLKKNKLYIGKIKNNDEEEEDMMRVVIYRSFAIFIVQSFTFSVQV